MLQARALDFSRAFYLTSDFEQASKWAKTSVLRRGDGVAGPEANDNTMPVLNLYFRVPIPRKKHSSAFSRKGCVTSLL